MIDRDRLRARLAVAGYRAGGGEAGCWTALFAFAAGRPADAILAAIGAAAARYFAIYAMTTGPRIAEFVAQTAHETGGYRVFVENLNYGAEALARTWPRRFAQGGATRAPNATARALANRPQAIANVVYARRREGNVEEGDGWRYRGRGMLQLTFKGNYARFGKRLGIDLVNNPELAADPATSLRIALEFWKTGDVNACCDAGDYRGARGITNCGTRTPAVAPVGLADVAARRARLLPLFACAGGRQSSSSS